MVVGCYKTDGNAEGAAGAFNGTSAGPSVVTAVIWLPNVYKLGGRWAGGVNVLTVVCIAAESVKPTTGHTHCTLLDAVDKTLAAGFWSLRLAIMLAANVFWVAVGSWAPCDCVCDCVVPWLPM